MSSDLARFKSYSRGWRDGANRVPRRRQPFGLQASYDRGYTRGAAEFKAAMMVASWDYRWHPSVLPEWKVGKALPNTRAVEVGE